MAPRARYKRVQARVGETASSGIVKQGPKMRRDLPVVFVNRRQSTEACAPAPAAAASSASTIWTTATHAAPRILRSSMLHRRTRQRSTTCWWERCQVLRSHFVGVASSNKDIRARLVQNGASALLGGCQEVKR